MEPKPRLLTRFDDVFFAYDKPAGLAVHQNAEGLCDLVSWLKKQRSLPRDVKPGHRLDRATSGVVLCGAGRKARAQIASWLNGDAEKYYLALVAGMPKVDEAVLEAPLFDHREGAHWRPRRSIRSDSDSAGLPCSNSSSSRAEDQIRRHLADLAYRSWAMAVMVPSAPSEYQVIPTASGFMLPACIGERVIEAPLPRLLTEHLERLTVGVASNEDGWTE